MSKHLPDLKEKIEELIKDLKYGGNITELICVLENPLGGQIQVTLSLNRVDDEDDCDDTYIEPTEETPIIKINGGKIL